MAFLNKLLHGTLARSNFKIICETCSSFSNTLKTDINAKSFHTSLWFYQESRPRALRNLKPKSKRDNIQYFVDIKQLRVTGGKGGDGAIMFMNLCKNEFAGPGGGDGGNGGHVIFEVSENIKDLKHLKPVNEAEQGEAGANDNCTGKNAKHLILRVPVGTIVRNTDGVILADLDKNGMMFLAARGGGGGHGNSYFKSDIRQAPKISEYGALGENLQYVLEVRSMAHIGLIGFPNAGKSTFLRAVTRARPKVASYPFTTMNPHLGIVEYDDYEQISIADLPGLVPDSHKNRGLGITFLKHAERCSVLLFMIDMSEECPWEQFEILRFEISQFNEKLNQRPCFIVANKMDLPDSQEKLELMKQKLDFPIIPISAKYGMNTSNLLTYIREVYDREIEKQKATEEQNEESS